MIPINIFEAEMLDIVELNHSERKKKKFMYKKKSASLPGHFDEDVSHEGSILVGSIPWRSNLMKVIRD